MCRVLRSPCKCEGYEHSGLQLNAVDAAEWECVSRIAGFGVFHLLQRSAVERTPPADAPRAPVPRFIEFSFDGSSEPAGGVAPGAAREKRERVCAAAGGGGGGEGRRGGAVRALLGGGAGGERRGRRAARAAAVARAARRACLQG